MGGKSKAPPQVTQTNTAQMSPEQRQLYELALPSIQSYASSPATMFGGQTMAGFNPDEVAGQDAARTAAGAGAGIANNAQATNQFLLDPALLSPDTNPYLKASGDAITRTATDNLLERILPSIRGGSTVAGGMYSGGASKEGISAGLAAGKTSQGITDSLAGLYNNAYSTGLSTLGSAASRAPNMQAMQLFGPQVLSAVGGQQRALEQAQLDEAQNKFYTEQALPLLRAQDLLGLIQGIPGGSGTTTVNPAMPKKNKWGAAAGGALAGATAGSAFGPVGTVLGGLGGAGVGYFG